MGLRIGLVIYGSLTTVSGGYLYDRMLVERLRSRGHDVRVLAQPWRPYPWRLADNLAPHPFEADLDLMLQDELNHASLFLLNRSLRGRMPIVSIVHHLRSSEQRPTWQNMVYAQIERAYLGSVDGFIFNSRTTEDSVRRLVGKRGASVVAYPAANLLDAPLSETAIRDRARAGPPLRITFLGNVIPRKGLHTLLAALAKLPHQANWRLSVIGDLTVDPSYTTRIRRQIGRLRIAERVQLLGRLPDTALTAALRASHVLAVPSSYEGYGIAYLEGMCMGLPAIGTTAGAAWEIITPGQDGFLVPVDNAPVLADALGRLVRDPVLLEAMSLAAGRRAAAQPTWCESMDRAAELVEGVCA